MIFAVTAIISIIDYFTSGFVEVAGAAANLRNFAIVLYAYSLTVGLVEVTVIRARHLQNPRIEKWRRYQDGVFLILLWGWIIAYVIEGANGPFYLWTSEWLATPYNLTIGGTSALWFGLANYRLVKLRTWDSSIFAISAFLWLFSSVPLLVSGQTMWLYDIEQWILEWPANAGGKALAILSSLGMISLGVRSILGLQRGVLGGGEE
jgi:hypothetical protein